MYIVTLALISESMILIVECDALHYPRRCAYNDRSVLLSHSIDCIDYLSLHM